MYPGFKNFYLNKKTCYFEIESKFTNDENLLQNYAGKSASCKDR